jgi:hypothetical protein
MATNLYHELLHCGYLSDIHVGQLNLLFCTFGANFFVVLKSTSFSVCVGCLFLRTPS